ncbi:hypothetical protein A3C09_03950 [Candidatus Uhrbacteria bacterium RIFCSPHIGHO2_02_FULL_47_44]|uniref:Uncharacterized protein n=1 Tax=Candidatus Uhrbacteria bacterium RIFCSPLOWO2_02_FULL_48_18 TaxID=1802408 RepID=A0A1F7VCF5_9BACT|nr:MAG: hypothetical protein A2839_01955 [Candidatus Uhrbacteria bacterium RIFCSPHIGHO2_01_FULL_47_10]OGL71831.1 MAG: hypothetical protein A3C09_03950 [Candidatus Uhrbacteria bacterium RIFCSPHIGHO2_02_FULL_47_44]OGL77056.1 MAG: hypothetical protein A3E97_01495 [Candidatus Uhrbacteria bacterium RIFCSPHIGHO2_12_FULL_47_12]OGL80595.1 MAG: hypothetical protein A3B20_04335 [Candidatus Uhrbacteria bacterium RIFCSPLOWO2_01_FULL_47_17]OGL88222.1 MAG: hypothetical protein A3I41_00645 [Candidatus Uhrbact
MTEQALLDLVMQWHHAHPIVMPVAEVTLGLIGLKVFVWPTAKWITDTGLRLVGLDNAPQHARLLQAQRRQHALEQQRRAPRIVLEPVVREPEKKKKKPKPEEITLPDAETNADMYVEWCVQRLQDDTTKEAELIGDKIDHLRMNELNLLNIAEQSADHKRILDAIAKRTQEQRTASMEQFMQCADRSEVARIEITEYGWCIVTTSLKMEWNGIVRALGKMEIHLDLMGRMRIYNQTNRITNETHVYDHPLIRNGIPFLPGVIEAAVIQAVAEHNLGTVLDVLLPFLTRVTEKPFVAITEWPEAQTHVRLARQI